MNMRTFLVLSAAALSAVGHVIGQVPAAPAAPQTTPPPIAVPSPAVPMPGGDLPPVEPAPIDPAAVLGTVQPPAGLPSPEAGMVPGQPAAPESGGVVSAGSAGAGARDFQQTDVGQALRLLARQAKINVVVSDMVQGTISLRLEDKTPMEAIKVIVTSKGLIMDEVEGVYYIKTQAERQAEPTESAFYTFSYARADAIAPLLQSQLQSGVAPQFDTRTNTIFYRETRSNLEKIGLFLETVDRATKQVMIEARLVEVTANPKQSYGINWAGTLGGSSSGQTFRFGGSSLDTYKVEDGVIVQDTVAGVPFDPLTQSFRPFDFVGNVTSSSDFFSNLGNQFAIMSAPAMSFTLRLLNEDKDAEFLAHPRIVTADNQQATIAITRNQPVPQLNFNEQTATAVFGGFEDVIFGNTLVVRPSVNKNNFITLSVKPTISNKVGDEQFAFAGAVVRAPVIDTRELESNVLIKSGDTLAIGGLLQDESNKDRSKVPILGDIPILGYMFQERINARTKRNLLVFVTPTIVDERYGTGLEDQVTGLKDSGEEFADPNGWRNNARGAYRLVPTSQRQLASDYPVPGMPIAPKKVGYKTSVAPRER